MSKLKLAKSGRKREDNLRQEWYAPIMGVIETEWLNHLNNALEYIEEQLDGEIEISQLAKLAHCSDFHFQRMFSYVVGIPLAEYIRRRRMTRAAHDLQNTDDKILDIALRYGYDSPTSFNRAFQSVHGIAPSAARTKNAKIKAYPPISFKLNRQSEVVAMSGNYPKNGVEVDFIVGDSLTALALYEKIFEVERVEVTDFPKGQNEVVFTLYGTRFHMLDENQDYGLFAPKNGYQATVWFNIIVPDIHAVHTNALANGCIEIQAVTEMEAFGVVNSMFKDPFEYVWMLHEVRRVVGFEERMDYFKNQMKDENERTDVSMNPGQEMFYKFFMELTVSGKEEEAKALLNAGFERQAAGTFDKAYLDEVMPKYFELIRPECTEELQKAMEHFGGNLK